MHTARRSGRSRSVMHCMRSREDHNASKAMLLTTAAPGPEGEDNNNNNNNFTYTSVPTRPRGPPNYRN